MVLMHSDNCNTVRNLWFFSFCWDCRSMNTKSLERSGMGIVRIVRTVMNKKMALNHEEITRLA